MREKTLELATVLYACIVILTPLHQAGNHARQAATVLAARGRITAACCEYTLSIVSMSTAQVHKAKTAPSSGAVGSQAHLPRGSLGSYRRLRGSLGNRVHILNGTSISSAVSAGLANVSNTGTNRPRNLGDKRRAAAEQSCVLYSSLTMQ